ncbi:single-stranded DNA-binding protein [Ructibacterium gallinarum]|uniref:single-stranded DNA-binding protein n=1 Tax=Ructibacterium gallinarum TaxID=2779355 RepID=UPI001CF8FEA9|nr:single-stranded DNA-binding protein [Ructibacterium gallinarum]
MINKAILMGRLTRDPELRHTSSGTPVCSFSIAIDNGYGDKRQTDFINCVAWNKTAEFVSNYFSKGKMIIVIGRIATRTWEGQDGKKNYATEVVASEVSFGESKRSQDGSSYQPGSGADMAQSAPSVPEAPAVPSYPGTAAEDAFTPLLDTDDDLPF